MVRFFNLPKINQITEDSVTPDTIVLIGSKVVTESIHTSKGMKNSADKIREASLELPGYLSRGNIDIHRQDIVDLGNYGRKKIGKKVKAALKQGALPIVLGGDHATTYFSLRDTELSSLLWLDSHLDFARSNELPQGKAVSHASALRLLVNKGKSGVVMGFRGYASIKSEISRARKANVEIYPSPLRKDQIINGLINHSAISLDLDFFSATEFPAVRTPEIYGTSINEFVEVLRTVKNSFTPRYIDIVEYLPSRDTGSYALIFSQLLLEILGALLGGHD